MATTLLLCGCNHLRFSLGTRTPLAKLPVETMVVTLPRDPGIAPGEKSPMVVNFTNSAGESWTTEGAGKGRIEWHDLVVAADVVKVNKHGVLSVSGDPRQSDGRTGHVVVTAPSHPTLHAELDVPLRYDYPFVAAYAGSSGSSGSTGTDGTNGLDGSTGSLDPDHPSAGGNGGDGTDGANGGDGSAGSDGPDVHVRVALRAGTHPLLEVAVTASGYSERFFLVNPNGGSVTLSSEGGSGGSGGKGGRGGHGGSGGVGSPSGSSGRNGSDGRDGMSGFSGRPGSVTVIHDPQVTPFLAAIRVTKNSGRAIFSEEPVAALW